MAGQGAGRSVYPRTQRSWRACSMANPPTTAVPTPAPKPRFNETTLAIVGSFLIAMVLASIFVGNPFRAIRLAYLDYSHTPAGGAAKADTVNAPNVQPGTEHK